MGACLFASFPVLLGLSLTALYFYLRDSKQDQLFIFIILIILASICLILAIIALIFDLKEAHRKDREKKIEESRKALRESVKRLNPHYTEKQIDDWMTGL